MRDQLTLVFIAVLMLGNVSCSSTKKDPLNATTPPIEVELSLSEQPTDKKTSRSNKNQSLQRPFTDRNGSSPGPLKNTSRFIADGIFYLQEGDEIKAHNALSQALRLNPKSLMANKLLQQINSDPVASLGESHSEYKLQEGETISGLAQRFLGDSLLFHILARYNNIQKPKHVRAGQLIKIPNTLVLKSDPQDSQVSHANGDHANTDEKQPEATAAMVKPMAINNEPLALLLDAPVTTDLAKQGQTEPYSQLERQAKKLIKKQQYQFVIDILKPKIAESAMANIDNTSIINLLTNTRLSYGEHLARQQLYAEAVEQMSEILQLDIKNEQAKIRKQAYHSTLKVDRYYQQGKKALLARKFQAAITAFSQVIQLQSNYLDSQQQLTQANKQLALEYYSEAVKLRRRQQLNEAMDLLDKVLILDPENILARNNRDQVADMINKLKGIKK